MCENGSACISVLSVVAAAFLFHVDVIARDGDFKAGETTEVESQI